MSAIVPPRSPSITPYVARIQYAVEAILRDFSTSLPELRMSVLSTADGRPLTAYLVRGGDGARISAIVSSLLAICETASKELIAGACTSAIVTAERLNIIVIRVGDRAWPLVLAAAFEVDLMLGAALRKTNDIGAQISAAVTAAAQAATV